MVGDLDAAETTISIDPRFQCREPSQYSHSCAFTISRESLSAANIILIEVRTQVGPRRLKES